MVAPATVEDARGMLWTALCDPDPVIIFEHALLYGLEEEIAPESRPVPLEGAVIRPGIYPVTGQLTLLRALALSGGFAPYADTIRLTRAQLAAAGSGRLGTDARQADAMSLGC